MLSSCIPGYTTTYEKLFKHDKRKIFFKFSISLKYFSFHTIKVSLIDLTLLKLLHAIEKYFEIFLSLKKLKEKDT